MENLQEIYQNLPADHFFVESFGLLEGRPGRPPVDFHVFFKSQNRSKMGPLLRRKNSRSTTMRIMVLHWAHSPSFHDLISFSEILWWTILNVE